MNKPVLKPPYSTLMKLTGPQILSRKKDVGRSVRRQEREMGKYDQNNIYIYIYMHESVLMKPIIVSN